MSGAEEHVQVPRSLLDQVIEELAGGHDHDERVRQAGIREGQEQRGYGAGWNLGHDTGLGARRDDGYVSGILDGHQAGTRARQELAQRLLRRMAAKRPEREREPEQLEAGA